MADETLAGRDDGTLLVAQADPDHREPLRAELGETLLELGPLLIAPRFGPAAGYAGVVDRLDPGVRASGFPHWALDVWTAPERLAIESIGDGARQLRARQRNWWPVPVREARRTRLIAEKLPHVSAKPLAFPALPPAGALGAFTLLDRTTLLASARKTSPFPDGAVRFVEDKTGPPNRAYLKLWEAWLHMGEWPRPGEQVIDLGAAPGGWTYAAAALGAAVLAVDKAPLDPRVAALEGVTERRESAFALDPRQVGPVDWVICDVVCYPERLRHLVEAWRTAGAYRRAIFTVKFQGPPGLGVLDGLREYSGSTLKHLSCNKNEVTLLDRPPVG